MENLEQQIQDFWENRSTPDQRREILRQLEASGMEWKEFILLYYTKVLAGEEPGSLSDEQKIRVWQRLKDQHLTNVHELPVQRKQLSWLPWMAAASVLLIMIMAAIYNRQGQSAKSPLQLSQPSLATHPNNIIRRNTDAGVDSLTLPDRSLVLLAPGSMISYKEQFESSARNITLEGRALFEVAKDSARPFTVTAHGFATTALGTQFIIDATKPVISIRLLQGKVVVNANGDAGIAMQKMYLTPGQELKINIVTKKFDRITHDTKQARTNNKDPDDHIASLSFEKTSLDIVFRRLSEYYKTPILYDKTEVQGLSFTGEFKPSDELDLALKVICNVNQLSFTKQNETIVISKKQ